jgi:hypothetical protein
MKKPKGASTSDLLSMALLGCESHDVIEIPRDFEVIAA